MADFVVSSSESSLQDAASDKVPTSVSGTGEWDAARLAASIAAWQSAPSAEPDALLAPNFPWATWLSPSKAAVVKRGVRRTVYRIDVAETSYFVKHYRCPHWVYRLQNMLRRSASRREWLKSLELRRRNIPTAQPVALGELRLPGGLVGDNFFVTAGIPGAVPLQDFLDQILPQLPPAEQAALERHLPLQLAELLAKVHQEGIWHDDLHAGNVLVSQVGGQLQMFLIDLPGTKILRESSWARTRNSLVMLHSGLMELDWRQRWRFWRRYCKARRDLDLDANRRAAANEISAATWPYMRHVLRGRDKRCLRANRDFHSLTTPQGCVHATVQFTSDQLQEILRDPEAVLQQFHHWPAKISHSSVVVRAELMMGDQRITAAFKRSRAKSRFKEWLPGRVSRARHNWNISNALTQRGIATARPLLMCEVSGGDSYLATQWVEGGENLHLFGWRVRGWSPTAQQPALRHLATSLGALVGRLHAWNFAHRDLKACNVVVVPESESSWNSPEVSEAANRFQLMLVDLDGVRLTRNLGNQARCANLARLALSAQLHTWLPRTFFLRVLFAYLAQQPPSTGGIARRPAKTLWKKLWRQIAQRHDAMLSQRQRRGRTIA